MSEATPACIIFVGKDDHRFKTIANLSDDLGTKVVRMETVSIIADEKHPNRENVALFIIDILDKKGLKDAMQLVRTKPLSPDTVLFLVDDKSPKADLLHRCESEGIDCLIKPVVKELFIARVKHFLRAYKLKRSLENEVKERERVLASLLDEKRYAESLINSSMDMIISVDMERNIFEFNRRAQDTFGYSKDEIIGKPVDLLYADRDQSLTVYNNTMANHQYSAEIVNRRKSGELFPSLISASILVERGGKTLGLMGISRDISDLKRVEADLKRAKEDAEAANRAKSEFLTNMSHEIRTPMTSVIGYAELLEDGLTGMPELLEFVDSIKRNGQHLLRLINHILDLSQVEKGKLTLHPVYCSPMDITNNLYHIMRGRSNEKGVALSVKYVGEIPKFIHSDSTRILQCLVNLVGNAIKFTPEGGRVNISVEYLQNEGEPILRFQVKDTGIGIPQGQLQLIMEPFEQGDVPNDVLSQGVGLGLPITRRLAHILGGSLTAESHIESGSTFILTVKCGVGIDEIELIDVSKAKVTAGPAEIAPDRSPVDWVPTLEGKILVVEDNTDIRKLVTKILMDAGASVDAVDSGPPVLEKASAGPYDLILMDMQLPHMDGATVVKKLRKNGYKKPIVALTASAMNERLERFLDAGCDDCAVKPISRYELVSLAHKWLAEGNQGVSNKPLTRKKRRDTTKVTNGKKSTSKRITKNTKEKFTDGFQDLIYSSYHDDPDMLDIVKDYVHTLPIKLENITNALNENNLKALRKIVHGLHGSGGGFGFDVLSKYGEEIERMIDDGVDHEALQKLSQELRNVIERIMSAYKP